MSVRFLILGLDEPLRRQVKSDLKIAFPNAEVDMQPMPEDSQRNAELAAYTALFIGYEHGREDGEGKPLGPDSLLREFKGCGAPILILARGGNEMTAVDAVRAGAADYLPVRLISPPLLAARVKGALQARGAPPVERRRSHVRRTTVPNELPTAVSGYQVLQTLARSDRSAVYLARSEELGFNVALKVLRRAANVADAPADQERFAREYKIISQ